MGRFAAFLTVGLVSALVNAGSFTLLWGLIGLNYKICSALAYALSVVVHFIGNRYFVFRHCQPVFLLTHLKRYMLLLVINYAITYVIITLAVETVHLFPPLAMLIAIGVTVSFSYVLSQRFVFSTAQ